MAMRLMKQKYKDRKTKREIIPKNWSLDFNDLLGRRQRISLRVSNKKVAESYTQNIESIIAFKSRNRPFSSEIIEWLEKIPESICSKLASINLLDCEEFSATKTLKNHLKDWKHHLQECGLTPKHINQQYHRVKRIIEGCKFVYFTDIKESIVISWLMKQKSIRNHTDHPISNSTRNHNIRAIKSFCNWAVKEGRILKSPLANLKFFKEDLQLRRSLTSEEIERLLKTTPKQPPVLGIDGKQRALIYRIAIETGLRASEIKALTVENINFKTSSIILDGRFTKNSQTARLPLRESTLELLKEHAATRQEIQKLFDMPYKQSVMIKQDYKAAKIDYDDNGSGKLDFHSLRHTFGTMLAKSGTHPKVAQQLMRHKKIEMTMNIYTHISPEQTREAVNSLPAFA